MKILLNIIGIFFGLFPFLLVFGLVIFLFYCWKAHVRIKFKTFFKKGFKAKRGDFGTYCYVGKQGKGKTLSLVEYLVDNNKKIKVFSNIYNIKNVDDITYYDGFIGLLKIKDDIDNDKIITNKQIIIVYDEIFTELQKKSNLSAGVIDFLCQMRKRGIIFLTTAQEWAEIPLSFRRFCRYQITCNIVTIFNTSFLIKVFRDAENMKWSNDEQEHIAPIKETTITKCRKYIADSYDTYLRISSISVK